MAVLAGDAKQYRRARAEKLRRDWGGSFYFSRCFAAYSHTVCARFCGFTVQYWPDTTAMLRRLLLVERASERRSPAREECGGNNEEAFSAALVRTRYSFFPSRQTNRQRRRLKLKKLVIKNFDIYCPVI